MKFPPVLMTSIRRRSDSDNDDDDDTLLFRPGKKLFGSIALFPLLRGSQEPDFCCSSARLALSTFTTTERVLAAADIK